MGAVETKLRIMNDTNRDIVKVHAWGLDMFRWSTPYRPDLQYAQSRINSGFCKEKVLKLNPNGPTCFFNMTLVFSDGTEDCFKINQKHAVGEISHFEHLKKTHILEYARENNNTLVITVKNTFKQLVDEKVKLLNEEGIFYTQSGEHEKALNNFDAALVFVQDDEVKEEITQNKIKLLVEISTHLYKESLESKNHIKLTKAEFMLIEARNNIKKAHAMDPSPEIKHILHNIEQKLQEFHRKNNG